MNNVMSLILFILNITVLVSYGSGWQWIGGNKKFRWIAGNGDCHGEQRYGVGHIQGFTWSHWMPPMVECLCRIAPVAAMVDEFEWNTQNTTKTQLLASNNGTFWLLVVIENFNPKTDSLISSSMRQAWFKCETPRLELESSAILLSADKILVTKIGAYLCP